MEHEGRATMFRMIRANISTHGRHITLVQGGPLPRFAYTIGASTAAGAELVLAGATYFYSSDVPRILNGTAELLQAAGRKEVVELPSLGPFSLRPVHETWHERLLLGVRDFYDDQVPALQLVPEARHWTVDIPNMAKPWDAATEPVWRWLQEPWEYPVPSESVATTNLAALQGYAIIEAARWSEEEWELFAGYGPDVAQDEARSVPLGTLLAVDPSLAAVTALEIDQGLWREGAESPWNEWR